MAGFGSPTNTPSAPFDLLSDDYDRSPGFWAVACRETRTRPFPSLAPGDLSRFLQGAHRP